MGVVDHQKQGMSPLQFGHVVVKCNVLQNLLHILYHEDDGRSAYPIDPTENPCKSTKSINLSNSSLPNLVANNCFPYSSVLS